MNSTAEDPFRSGPAIDTAVIALVSGAARCNQGTAWLCGPGLALTAWHVVNRAGANLQLTFADGTTASAEMLDFRRMLDVALLRLTECSSPSLWSRAPISISTDGDIYPGDAWFARGHAGGSADLTAMHGRIRQIVRPPAPAEIVLSPRGSIPPLVEGMSGSALIDSRGVAVGILVERDRHGEELYATRLDDAWFALSKWRNAHEGFVSGGAVSRYLAHQRTQWRSSSGDAASFPQPGATPCTVDLRYRQPLRNDGQVESDKNLSVAGMLDLLRKEERNLILRGDPGSGKSVLLRDLALASANDWLDLTASQNPIRADVPLLVHASVLAGEHEFDEAIGREVPSYREPIPEGFKWLLLIDGLDEVVDASARQVVVDKIQRRVNYGRARKPALRMVLASRPLAVLDEFGSSEVLQLVIKPFDGSQLKQLAFGTLPDEAPKFLQEVDNAQIKGLLTTPAMASITLRVFRDSPSGRLPRERSVLYEQFLDVSLRENPRVRQQIGDMLTSVLPDEGRCIAEGLYAARESIVVSLATDVQYGHLGIASPGYVDATIERARLPAALLTPERRPEAAAVMLELLRSCGLFVESIPGDVLFLNNTLREALVARGLAEQGHGDGASVGDFVRRWSDARWREVVLLLLARWSRESDAVRDLVWNAVTPKMLKTPRGVNFAAAALTEGVVSTSDQEERVVRALFDRVASWNPCMEYFSEFISPSPIDALRPLAQRSRVVEELIHRLDRATKDDCPKKLHWLTDLVFDISSIDRLAPLLESDNAVAAYAVLMIARAGGIERLIGKASDYLQDKNIETLALAREIGKGAALGDILKLLDDENVRWDLRLSIALEGSLRFVSEALVHRLHEIAASVEASRSSWPQEVAVGLLQRMQLELESADDEACIDIEALAPDSVIHLVQAGNQHSIALPNELVLRLWRIARSEETAADLRARAMLALLDHGAEAHVDYVESTFSLAQRLAGSVSEVAAGLARAGRPELLQAQIAQVRRKGEKPIGEALQLAQAGFRENALQLLEDVERGNVPEPHHLGFAFWELGRLDKAARWLFEAADENKSKVMERLMEYGHIDVIEKYLRLRAPRHKGWAGRRIALRCLHNIGAADRLERVARDPDVDEKISLYATRLLHDLGYEDKAEDIRRHIALHSGLGGGSQNETEAAALERFVSDSEVPVSEVMQVSGWEYPDEHGNGMVGFFDRNDLAPDDAMGILKVHTGLKQSVPYERVARHVIGRDATADTAASLLELAIASGRAEHILGALAEYVAAEKRGDDLDTKQMEQHFGNAMTALKVAEAEAADGAADRLWYADRISRAAPKARSRVIRTVVDDHFVDIWKRLEAAVLLAEIDDEANDLVALLPPLLHEAMGQIRPDTCSTALDALALLAGTASGTLTATWAASIASMPDVSTDSRLRAAGILMDCDPSATDLSPMRDVAQAPDVALTYRLAAARRLLSRQAVSADDVVELASSGDVCAATEARLDTLDLLWEQGCHIAAVRLAEALLPNLRDPAERQRCAGLWGCATLSLRERNEAENKP